MFTANDLPKTRSQNEFESGSSYNYFSYKYCYNRKYLVKDRLYIISDINYHVLAVHQMLENDSFS